jgi:2-polyprenyl-6-methoxyphenol hydroxylase-like FAD-dependent oxidoreductase
MTRLVLRRGGGDVAVRARLVVGAEARGSRTAELAGLPTRRSENLRFAYWGYFKGPPLTDATSVNIWFLEPDVAIATPTDAGLVAYVAMPHRSRIDEFKRAPEHALREFMVSLPDAPPIARSRLVGKLDLTNEARPVTADRLALVGDAALAADPAAAIGCGFALESAALARRRSRPRPRRPGADRAQPCAATAVGTATSSAAKRSCSTTSPPRTTRAGPAAPLQRRRPRRADRPAARRLRRTSDPRLTPPHPRTLTRAARAPTGTDLTRRHPPRAPPMSRGFPSCRRERAESA